MRTDGEHENRWRRQSNKELHNLYSTKSIIWVIKSVRIRQTVYVAVWEQGRCVQWFGGKPKGKRSLGRARNGWENNINCILRNRMEGCGLDSPGSGKGLVVASCKHSIKYSDSIMCMKFSYWLRNNSLLKDSALQN